MLPIPNSSCWFKFFVRELRRTFSQVKWLIQPNELRELPFYSITKHELLGPTLAFHINGVVAVRNIVHVEPIAIPRISFRGSSLVTT